MIETQYIKKSLQENFKVFEVVDGWLVSNRDYDHFQGIDAQKPGQYSESQLASTYRKLNYLYDSTELTANPLAALRITDGDKNTLSILLKLFPDGKLKEITMNSQITDIP
ncbi:hypothetical protein PT274_03515 [Leuconostocaceae bacterium ESL0958]|nr:hypothetical protein [Leuconostocaceae bacterium ESL0958]